MEVIVDVPEQIGSLGAWLAAPAASSTCKSVRTTYVETAAPGTGPSEPIPIPSTPRRTPGKPRIWVPFEARTRHLPTSPGIKGLWPFQDGPMTFSELNANYTGNTSLSIRAPTPDSLLCALSDHGAAGSASTAGLGGRAAQLGSLRCTAGGAPAPPQAREVVHRSEPAAGLLDGCPISAGPPGDAASLPQHDTQGTVSLAHLCKALSSPAAHMAREAGLPKSGLTEAFDAARAIAAFERSTAWRTAVAVAAAAATAAAETHRLEALEHAGSGSTTRLEWPLPE